MPDLMTTAKGITNGTVPMGAVFRITSYNVCYTKLLRVLGEGAEVGIAGHQLRIGVADADDGPAVELV